MIQSYTFQRKGKKLVLLVVILCTLNFYSLAETIPSFYDQETILKRLAQIKKMADSQIQARKVYAVRLGSSVSWSSSNGFDYANYMLDNSATINIWHPLQHNKQGCWIQVSTFEPQYWIQVITQGRRSMAQWTKTMKIAYSLNGQTWNYVDNGRIFQANSDQNSKVTMTFSQPVFAKTIRLYPQTYQSWPSLSFQAIYLDFPQRSTKSA